MASYNTSNIKNGLKVLLNGDPCEIIENSFHKPGKGQAFSKIKLKNLSNGRVNEKTLKIGDSLNSADVQTSEMQYLYNDEESYFFSNCHAFFKWLFSNGGINWACSNGRYVWKYNPVGSFLYFELWD